MPIFGQVWLWSSLAFLLGALLCWLLVARPARNRVGELEAQLTTRARRFATPPERPEPRRPDGDRGVVPGFDRDDDADYRTRAYGGLRDTPPPLPPERDRLAQYADPLPPESDAEQSGTFPPLTADDRGFTPLPAEQPPGGFGAERVQDEPDVDSRPAAATQYLDVSSGSLSAPPEVPPMSQPPSDRGWFDDELEGDAANQAPEEQAAVPRNRHHLEDPDEDDDPFADRLIDDEAEDISATLDASGDEPRSAIEDEDGGTVFTQRTHPIPGELIRQIDEAGKQESDHLVDDLADSGDEVARRDRTVEAEAVTPQAAFTEPESSGSRFTEPESSSGRFTEPESSGSRLREPESSGSRFAEPEPSAGRFAEPAAAAFTEPESTGSRFAEPESSQSQPAAFTEPESSQGTTPPEAPAEQTEIVAVVPPVEEEKPVEPTRTGSSLPKRVPQKNRISQGGGVSVRVEPTPSALPKRVPGKPRHQIPFGVAPSSTPEPAAAVAADAPPEPPRSLFEPIVPAADEGTSTPPPPHRLRQGSGSGRGPFGPGSAMPLPGGASPSPEFTIKASVAALRYCTPESPQFGRTVAEVWFRTAADAERVGFRPVG